MPEAKILTRLKHQLKQKGKSPEEAQRIAVAALQRAGNLKKGSTEPTAKGVVRGNMTPAERAKDRAVKYRGGTTADYKYKVSNNTAVKRKK